MSPDWRVAAWFLCAASLAGAILGAIVLSALGFSDHVEPADAVVVPGNTVHPDGKISNRLQGRLDAALAVYRTGNCKVIFVSGAVGVEGVDESEAMKAYLVTQGVPPDRIIQDDQGFTTAATARNAALALHQRGYRTVIAVSQFFHVPRLRWLLASQGLRVVGSEHAGYFELRDLYSLFREVAAMSVLLPSAAVRDAERNWRRAPAWPTVAPTTP
jgi:vancomycin permeability regulator SanA